MVHEYEYKVVVRSTEHDKDDIGTIIKASLDSSSDISVQSVVSTRTDNYHEFPMTWAHLYILENPEGITDVGQIPNDAYSYCSFLFQRSDIFLDRMEEHQRENYNFVKITHYMGHGYNDVIYLGQFEPEVCLRKVLEYYEMDF